jgi:hypothetical protein
LTAILKARNSKPPSGGLSIEETVEFEMLDALPPFDDNGEPAWIFEGEPTTRREKRWLELYTKKFRAKTPVT